ncbi:hypothetical protein CLOM_g16856 [Closterium sp. NIES-68]|nr:hypothetical protein CLOM_g16856 [Closterium sp. NIES-68]GJP64487.1 hypothetical protein CLOP_g21469 [Closterium sp. NIES-67]
MVVTLARTENSSLPLDRAAGSRSAHFSHPSHVCALPCASRSGENDSQPLIQYRLTNRSASKPTISSPNENRPAISQPTRTLGTRRSGPEVC